MDLNMGFLCQEKRRTHNQWSIINGQWAVKKEINDGENLTEKGFNHGP
jgi:hypothetical protein